ncbi:hypothetical protein [Roseimaritima sediminicola]|uniref:hypothetical protein n=1 Tax=Roseimaritima sediminicola TaxID=2662066 RepID=UPI001298404A|nr:hypothetical protein [Roseimaritima sediminicola]
METSLHRQLKQSYAGGADEVEVTMGPYRIDAVCDGELVEVQHGSLVAIRDKIQRLLEEHRVRVVKPIIGRKRIVRQRSADGPVASRRYSPSRGSVLELFDELVYFTRVFPHSRLVLEVPVVEVEEWRLPPTRSRRRRRQAKYRVKDVVLTRVLQTHRFVDSSQLLPLIDSERLTQPFCTAQLAGVLEVERWVAQRIAYVLRETGAIAAVGRRGNTILYATPETQSALTAAA